VKVDIPRLSRASIVAAAVAAAWLAGAGGLRGRAQEENVNTIARGVDLSGEWTPVREEDNTGNTELGDWVGIPLNEAARLRAMAWVASIQTLPEWQCRPHAVSYISRGPSQLRISKDVDPVSRQITAWHMEWLRSIDKAVYMDGRPHPEKLEPSYYGHSIGHWEGDTLVVDSTGYNESFWFDRSGLPHTEKLHTIEHFTRTNSLAIKYELTVDDPGAYTATWSTGFDLRWEDGTELFEYVCQQMNYAPELMVGGGTSIDRTSTIIP